MISERRNYPKEFKENAIELLIRGNKTAVELAKDLGIGKELLYGWKRDIFKKSLGYFLKETSMK